MSVLLRDHWKDLNRSVWPALVKRKAAPPDVYVEVLRVVRQTMRIDNKEDIEKTLSDPKITKEMYLTLSSKLKLLDEALNDSRLARAEFFRLPVPESEADCIEVLEAFHRVLSSEFGSQTAEQYRVELKNFIGEYNLRYDVSNQCKLILSVPGVLASQYSRLRNELGSNQNLAEALLYVEESLARLKDTTHEERNCVSVASNLIEGVICQKSTNGKDTLTAAIDGCDVFPHWAVKESIKNFYKFASNFPNVRHGARGGPRERDLKKDDALLAVALAVAFSSYIFNNDAADPILEGEL